MTTPNSEPSPIHAPVSIGGRIARMLRWLITLSLSATLVVSLLPYPIERTAVDPFAPRGESDYVTVHGLPFYFLVTDSTVVRRPQAITLIRHFSLDWALAFAVFASPVILFELIRIAAFYAARRVHSLNAKTR